MENVFGETRFFREECVFPLNLASKTASYRGDVCVGRVERIRSPAAYDFCTLAQSTRVTDGGTDRQTVGETDIGVTIGRSNTMSAYCDGEVNK